MYPIHFSDKAKKDISRLKKEGSKLLSKVLELILDMANNPFEGLGKPEALKGDLQGCWSRRITDKHRLVYRIKDGDLEILSCYGHYGDR